MEINLCNSDKIGVHVTLDQTFLYLLERTVLRRHVGMVPQWPPLFSCVLGVGEVSEVVFVRLHSTTSPMEGANFF